MDAAKIYMLGAMAVMVFFGLSALYGVQQAKKRNSK
jgi:hypothetical protein